VYWTIRRVKLSTGCIFYANEKYNNCFLTKKLSGTPETGLYCTSTQVY
jgi:hypothetical protein